jgi:hypothetical protein
MTDIANIITLLEQKRTAINSAIEALGIVRGQPAVKKRGRPKGSKDRSSVEGRQRQAEAMRVYWAAKKAGKKGPKKATKKATKKRRLTAAGRKALSENMKRMWREKKLGKDY